MSPSPSRRPINTSAVSLANSTSHHADCVGKRDGGGSMCGAASVQSVVIRIPYISKWSLGTENYTKAVLSAPPDPVLSVFDFVSISMDPFSSRPHQSANE